MLQSVPKSANGGLTESRQSENPFPQEVRHPVHGVLVLGPIETWLGGGTQTARQYAVDGPAQKQNGKPIFGANSEKAKTSVLCGRVGLCMARDLKNRSTKTTLFTTLWQPKASTKHTGVGKNPGGVGKTLGRLGKTLISGRGPEALEHICPLSANSWTLSC